MTKTKFTAEPGKQEVRITRDFDAPRDLIFKAFTDPKHIPNWWGPSYLTTEVDKMDVRPGGQWRFVQQEPNGEKIGFHGVYHDVTAPERVISTFEFEGMPGHVILETITFEALPDGKTRVNTLSVYQSLADRDGMVASGMEGGSTESWERMAVLLSELQATR